MSHRDKTHKRRSYDSPPRREYRRRSSSSERYSSSSESERSYDRKRSSRHYKRSHENSHNHETKKDLDNTALCLIAHNISSDVNEDVIKKVVGSINIEYKYLWISSESPKSVVIEFFTVDEADKFLEVSSGRLVISGCIYGLRHLTTAEVKQYYEDKTRQYINSDACKVLILRGIDLSTTTEDILSALSKINEKPIFDVRLVKDKITNVARGFAFVEMASSKDAYHLLQSIKSIPDFTINNKKVIVNFARNNTSFVNNVKNNSVASNAIAAGKAASQITADVNPIPLPIAQNPDTPGDSRNYYYDQTTGYYIDPTTNLYQDPRTGTFYNPYTQDYLYLDPSTQKLVAFSKNKVDTETPGPETVKEKGAKKTPTQTSEARRIAEDMNRWAKRINQESSVKSSERKNLVRDSNAKRRMATELQEKIEAKSLFNSLSTTVRKDKEDVNDEELLLKTIEEDPHINLSKLVCILCQRKFSSKDVLIKHVTLSDLHKSNLENVSKNI